MTVSMKKVTYSVIVICVVLLILALIRECILAEVMNELFSQAVVNEAKWAYSYGQVLNDAKLNSDEKLLRLRLVNETEIPPVVAQLDSLSPYNKKVPEVRNQLIQTKRLEEEADSPKK
jgi:hypothetical protein